MAARISGYGRHTMWGVTEGSYQGASRYGCPPSPTGPDNRYVAIVCRPPTLNEMNLGVQ